MLLLFDASAVDPTVFDWVTDPSLPGLSTRTGEFEFVAPSWVASEPAAATCALPADCFATWMSAGAPQPHRLGPPVGSWSDVWLVELEFDASAVDVAVLDWLTAPLDPGLRTRTSRFVFFGSTWVAEEAAPASCAFPADWSVL